MKTWRHDRHEGKHRKAMKTKKTSLLEREVGKDGASERSRFPTIASNLSSKLVCRTSVFLAPFCPKLELSLSASPWAAWDSPTVDEGSEPGREADNAWELGAANCIVEFVEAAEPLEPLTIGKVCAVCVLVALESPFSAAVAWATTAVWTGASARQPTNQSSVLECSCDFQGGGTRIRKKKKPIIDPR